MIGVERLALVAAERRHLDQPDRAIGAGDHKPSVFEADVGVLVAGTSRSG